MSGRTCQPKPTQTKAAAKKIITDFAARSTGGGLWKGLTRAKVAAGALVRIDDPDKIAQGDANLCGPSCFVRSVATDLPETYARAVASLYEYGSAQIGNRGMNHFLKPSADLLNYVLPATADMDQADWIILASLRDSENWFLRYSSINDGFSAMTMPGTVVKWFVQAGYTDVKEDTSLKFNSPLSNAQKASELLDAGYKVCLLINDNMLYTSRQDNGSQFPDHWVVLTLPITFHQGTVSVPKLDCFRDAPGPRVCVTAPGPGTSVVDKQANISFQVYSWGKTQRVPESGTLLTKSFLRNYYGYVACRL